MFTWRRHGCQPRQTRPETSVGETQSLATWAIENHARELDVQYLLGHSTSAMVRRYSATYDAAKAADAHAAFCPAARLLATEASAAG